MSAAKKELPFQKPSSTAGKTITVACKLPNGLHMDIPTAPGELPLRVSLRGANSSKVIGGYGITTGVPEDFFNEWIKLNQVHPAVKNGLIFAHKEMASVKAEAKERKELKHGMEGVNPDKPGAHMEPLDEQNLGKMKAEARKLRGLDDEEE